MKQIRILIFIPTYNESGNVERMARELAALNLDADILFLDDNSPDGTGPVLDDLACRIPRMSVVHRQGKQGIGSAHQMGIARGYSGGYDVLVTLDCDFTHDPKDIPRMLAALDGYDVSVGSRYMEAGSLPGWNLMRRGLTKFGHFLTSTLLGLPQDASGAFRAYDLRRVPQELFGLVTSRSYSFFFESLFVLVRNGLKVKEIPIVLPARTYGHSKLTLTEALRGGTYLLRLWLENLSHPERFRQGRPVDCVLEQCPATDWDAYWAKKQSAGALAYEVIAALYRKLFIRPNLVKALGENFGKDARVLHAGCGSGQADRDLHEHFRVTAVDISLEALALYGRNNPQVQAARQADIFRLPFESGTFDGVFNLGVMEHFDEVQIQALLVEFRRVLKPEGKIVLFWPHARATSVFVLGAVHFVMNRVLGKKTRLHPDEITRLNGKEQARKLLERAGWKLLDYRFGWQDMFVQAVIVGE
ncbi:glycosyltransferase [Fundidesulfovibrio putealis]|uniref:glycosyltransferase n=1 Tax=Fundidesulfovibrio putealis TaxID=270496 RepID=UPI00040A63EA|nr:glycosyltransferase [Fundidesulfovibrio putealis]